MLVRELNAQPDIHGILVQLPLPGHIDEEEILAAVSLEKDVDGLHPLNIGRLSMKRREPLFVPCTPKGCIELLDRTGVEIEGRHAVVLGRSNIVGLPVAPSVQPAGKVYSRIASMGSASPIRSSTSSAAV